MKILLLCIPIIILLLLVGCKTSLGEKEMQAVDFLVVNAIQDSGPTAAYFPSMTKKLAQVVTTGKNAKQEFDLYIKENNIETNKKLFFSKRGKMFYASEGSFIIYCFDGMSEIRYFTPR